jgi:hypothetical protein
VIFDSTKRDIVNRVIIFALVKENENNGLKPATFNQKNRLVSEAV